MNESNKNNPVDLDHITEMFDLDVDWNRPLSKADILYLLDRCPFLQMVSTDFFPDVEPEVKLVRAESGWDIHDYGDAMSASPGRFLMGGGYTWIGEGDEEGEGGSGGHGIINPGKGTVVKQAFDTACEMIDIAKAKGWGGVKLADGHPLMERGAWIRAEQLNFPLEGFTPTKTDKRVKAFFDTHELELGDQPEPTL